MTYSAPSRLRALLTSAAITAATLTGSAALAEGAGFAFSPLSLDIPALKGLSEGVKGIGGSKGYDVIVLDPKFDAPTQAQQLEQLITTGRIKGAWIIAVNPGSMGGVIEAAKAAGVALVVNGVPADYGFDGMQPGVTFANIDYQAFGGQGGDLAAECANAKLGGAGKALIIQNKEGTAGKAEVDAAMEGQLKAGAPGVEVVQTLITTDRAESLEKVSQALQANPDINVVISAHDEGGLGALGAFEAAGKEIPCLVDLGGNAEVVAAVDAGQMYGAVVLNFEGDLMQTFDAVEAMMKDPAAMGRQQSVPMVVQKAP